MNLEEFNFHREWYILSTQSMSDLTALLLDAKNEYRLQLEEIVTPSIVATFEDLWIKSIQEGGNRDGVLLFQNHLREIPAWNAGIISTKTREITYMYPYLDDLIAACIIAQLKIMSSIKLSQDRPKVQLKLPNTDTFVHELYIQTAKKLYQDPTMMSTTRYSVEAILAPLVSDAIERTIRKMIPFKDVLMAYLQNGGDTQVAQEALQNESDSSGDDGSFPKRQSDGDIPISESESSSSEDEDEIHVGGPVPTAPFDTHQYAAPLQQQPIQRDLPEDHHDPDDMFSGPPSQAPAPSHPSQSSHPPQSPQSPQSPHPPHPPQPHATPAGPYTQPQLRRPDQLFAGDQQPIREGF